MDPTKIHKPGLYDIPADRYHEDPVGVPSLSSSLAKLLIERSPRHCWTEHPRLNPAFERADAGKFDIGRAAHRLLLEGIDDAVVIDANDWRTKAAQEQRDAAYAAGRTPLLRDQYERVVVMVQQVRAQLIGHRDAADAFTAGRGEQTLVWQEAGVWCRCLLDWLPDDRTRPYDDLKTTAAAAHPDLWQRTAFNLGFDLQASFYRRGIRAVLGIDQPRFRFVVAETAPPHALCVIEMTPATLDLADRKVDAALDLWRWCLERDDWPGYPAMTCLIEPPPWHEARWLEREAREQDVAGGGVGMAEHLLHWQAPHDWKGNL